MGRAPRSLLGLATSLGTALGTAAAAVALTAAPAAASTTVHITGTTAAAVCDPALVAPAGSLVGDFWRSNNGERSVYGCPVTKERRYAGKAGSYQEFRNGKIVWSPNLGGGALVRAYRNGNNAVVRWSGLGRDWDFFNVRWSKDGGPATQVRVTRLTPWSGVFSVDPHLNADGTASTTNGVEVNRISFVVQGCDRGTFSSDCGPWSIGTGVRIAH